MPWQVTGSSLLPWLLWDSGGCVLPPRSWFPSIFRALSGCLSLSAGITPDDKPRW